MIVFVPGIQLLVPIPIRQLSLAYRNVDRLEVVYLRKELGVLIVWQSFVVGKPVPYFIFPRPKRRVLDYVQIEKVGYVGVLLGISILLEHTHRLQWGHSVEVVLDWVGALARLGQSIVTTRDVGESIERD